MVLAKTDDSEVLFELTVHQTQQKNMLSILENMYGMPKNFRVSPGDLRQLLAHFAQLFGAVSNRCRVVHPNSFDKCIWNYMYHHCKSTEIQPGIQIRNRSHSSDCTHSFGYLTVRGVGPNYESVNDLTTEVAKIFLSLA